MHTTSTLLPLLVEFYVYKNQLLFFFFKLIDFILGGTLAAQSEKHNHCLFWGLLSSSPLLSVKITQINKTIFKKDYFLEQFNSVL